MTLLVASLANVSRQGINPPGAGGDLLVYSATFAVLVVVWSPDSRRSSRGPRLSLRCPVKHKRRWEVGAIVLVLILG